MSYFVRFDGAAIVVFLGIYVISCVDGTKDNSSFDSRKLIPKPTIKETVNAYYQEKKCNPPADELVYRAETIWELANCDEILETLETVRVDSVSGLVVAFTRYSVGGQLFREVLRLRAVEHPNLGRVYGRDFQLFSRYGGNTTEAQRNLQEEIDKWEDASASWKE